MFSTKEIQILAESRLSDARKIQYIVNTKDFERLFELASNESKKVIKRLIQVSDLESLKKWAYNEKLKSDLELLNVKELRRLASDNRISDYHLFRKDELVYELRELFDRRDTESFS